MNASKFNFWQKWLTYANVITAIIGALVAFGGNSIFFEMHNSYSEDIFFDRNTFSGSTLEFKNFLFGIIGGTMVGFHLLMIMISEHAYKKREKWAYHALWLGMISWFVIDSGLSLYWGAWYNVVLINIPGFLLITLPLVMTRGAFR